jgi:DNA topoisomerase IA
MSKSLVIVESPAKAKTISKYLGKDFTVEASVGHIKDLPKNKIGVDLSDGSFTPELIVIPGKEKVVDRLKKLAKAATVIYLAPDPDREGEAIAAHLEDELRGLSKGNSIRRVTFNEITAKAVHDAFEHTRDVDRNLVDAQQTRRVLDRIVGYQISPLLWDKVRRGLSAGRVQTVALRLIVEREREIKAFVPVEYWTPSLLRQMRRPSSLLASSASMARRLRLRLWMRRLCRASRRWTPWLPRWTKQSGRFKTWRRRSVAVIRQPPSRPASCSRMLPASWVSAYDAPWA